MTQEPVNWAATTHRSASLTFDHQGRAFVTLAHREPYGRLQQSRHYPIGEAGESFALVFDRAAQIASARWWGVLPLPGDDYVDEAVGCPLTGDLVERRLGRPPRS